MIVISILICAFFACLFISFIISGVRKIKEVRASQELSSLYTSEEEHMKAIQETEEFEKGYFERIRNGEQSQQFLSVGSMMVCSFLRSLLASEGIPTYTENEHVNSMYSLNALNGNSSFSIKVYILIADYDRAYEIIAEYIASREKTDEGQSSIKKAKSVATAVTTGMFFVNIPGSAEEAIHGIMILPRVTG